MTEVKVRVGSLFTGIGGLDRGFTAAGFDIAWWMENEKSCRKLLKDKYPGVPGFGDITKTTTVPKVDVFVGGSPCQGFSIAGLRGGLGDERSRLVLDYLRLVESARPEWLVFENVTGLLSSNKGRDMGAILAALDDRGYRWAYRVLDASYFGVPQRRRRVFIVGRAGTRGAHPAEVLFESDIRPRDPKKKRTSQEIVAAAAAGGVAGSSEAGDSGEGEEAETVGAITGSTFGSGGADDNDARVGHHVSALQGGGRRGHRVDAEGAGLRESDAHQPHLRRPHAQPVVMRWREGKPGGGKGELLSDQSLTLAAANDQFVFDPSGDDWAVRRLIPLECERLQGFPDGYTEGFVDGVRYRMLGNAVATVVAEWIARRMMAVIEQEND